MVSCLTCLEEINVECRRERYKDFADLPICKSCFEKDIEYSDEEIEELGE